MRCILMSFTYSLISQVGKASRKHMALREHQPHSPVRRAASAHIFSQGWNISWEFDIFINHGGEQNLVTFTSNHLILSDSDWIAHNLCQAKRISNFDIWKFHHPKICDTSLLSQWLILWQIAQTGSSIIWKVNTFPVTGISSQIAQSSFHYVKEPLFSSSKLEKQGTHHWKSFHESFGNYLRIIIAGVLTHK